MKKTMGWIGVIRCGLHSGFPRCCIRFFLGPWSKMSLVERRQYLQSPGPGYVPCPACVAADNFVKAKSCPVGRHGGNVVGRFEAVYERQVDGTALLKSGEYFYRDKPGSFRLQVVNGHYVEIPGRSL